MRNIYGFCLLGALSLCAVCARAEPEVYAIDTATAVFAVVTHRAGFASTFAHNHIVDAKGYTASMLLDESNPTAARFTLEVPVSSLRVDDAKTKARYEASLLAERILDAPFPSLSDGWMRDLRSNMFGETQLDAQHFPMIRAVVENIQMQSPTKFIATISMTIRDHTAKHDVPVELTQLDEQHYKVHSLSAWQFTEFGIQPFRAMAGMLKNADQFHVIVDFVANRAK